MLNISFEYPTYLIIFLVILATAFSFALYYKDKAYKGLEKWKIYLMSILRFSFVFLILLLLLNPVIKQSSITEVKPIIVFAQDNSGSVLMNKDSLYYQNEYLQEVNTFINQISDDYDVKFMRFSEKTELDSIIDFSGSVTNISSVFSEVLSRYSGMNLGAVILATDGIYNQGLNPVYSRNIRFPVYPIALGDTVQQKDVIIQDVLHNRVAFYKNIFPVRILITAEKCEEEETKLTINRGEELIFERSIKLPADGVSKFIDLEIKADKMGLQHYNVFIEPIEGEVSIENNKADFIIDVVDNRQQILIIAKSPHPDIGALRFALKENPNFELDIKYIDNFNENVADYDLVILHQLPSETENLSNIFADITANNVSSLFIIGPKTNLQHFNNLSLETTISSQTGSIDYAQATVNREFRLFEIGSNIKTLFSTSPPLHVFFGNYNLSVDANILAYQNIGGITTDKPLIAFIDNFEYKTGFIFGEGLWRWRLTDFRHFSSHSNFKELINKTIQYLSTRRIDERLVTNYKRIYNENEPVIINAELYNDAFELVPNENISLKLIDENEKEYNYFFRDFSNSYRLDLGRLLPGAYSFEAYVNFNNKDYFSKGDFIVQELNIEAVNTTANHNLLYRIARKSGGSVVFPNNIMNLKELLSEDETIAPYAQVQTKSIGISDLYYLFFLIIAFAGVEWFFRKFWGSY